MNAEMEQKNKEQIDHAANRMIAREVETLRAELEQARRDIGRKDDALQLYAEFNTALNVALGLPEDNESDNAALEVVYRMRDRLSNILAVIHGDGGQYQSDHGTDKAVADALEKWRDRTRRIDELESAARWRKFPEETPTLYENFEVVTRTPAKETWVMCLDKYGSWCYNRSIVYQGIPLLWRPLPPLPEPPQ